MSEYLTALRWEEDMLEDRIESLKLGDADSALIEAYEQRLSEVVQRIHETEANTLK